MLDVEALYASEHDTVRRYFARRIGQRDPSLADDLTSATFLRAWERRDRYRPLPGVKPVAWLFMVARNILADYFRSERPTASLEVRADLGLEPAAPSRANTVEWVAVLGAAVSTLSPKQRAVIVGRFYEGRLQREMGDVASCDGVKKLQERALVNLRRVLEAA